MTSHAHHTHAAASMWLTAGPWFLLGAVLLLALACAANWWLKPRPITERPLTLADVNLDVTEPHRRTARHRRYDDADAARDNGRWRGVHREGRAPYTGAHRPARGRWRAPAVGLLDEATSWLTVADLHYMFGQCGLALPEVGERRELVTAAGGTR